MAFTNFSNLPTEIRLQIWRLAAPGGRVLKISPMLPSSPLRLQVQPQLLPANITKRQLPFPAILHVCRESRAVAYEILQHGFQISPPHVLEMALRADARVWWNPAADTLFLPSFLPAEWWGSRASDLYNISNLEIHESRYTYVALAQHLAIPLQFAHDSLKDEPYGTFWLPTWLQLFPQLETLTMIDESGAYPMFDPSPSLYRDLEVSPEPYYFGCPIRRSAPPGFKKLVADRLEEYKRRFALDWKTPTLEIMTLRRTVTDV